MIHVRDHGMEPGDRLMTAALLAALAAAAPMEPVYLPAGTYRVEGPINLQRKALIGDGRAATKLIVEGPYAALWTVDHPAALHDLSVSAPDAPVVFSARKALWPTLLRRVSFAGGMAGGVHLDGCQVVDVDQVDITGSKGVGLWARAINGTSLRRVVVTRCEGGGIRITGKRANPAASASDCTLLHPVVEDCRGPEPVPAIWLEGLAGPSVVLAPRVEKHRGDGILLTDTYCAQVLAPRVTAEDVPGARAIRMVDCYGCQVIGGGTEGENVGRLAVEAVELVRSPTCHVNSSWNLNGQGPVVVEVRS